jgi:hypothetical protein
VGVANAVADVLKVDVEALLEAARRLDALGQRVQSSVLGGEAVSRLLLLEGQRPGSRTGVSAGELGRALALVTGQVESAVMGFGSGLRVAAQAYHQVDVVNSRAALELSGEPPAGAVP